MTEGRRGPRTAFAALLLVPSGAAALAHEAVWARLWTPYAGAGVATSSAVVAGALLGLAAGAALGGRLTERVGRPARLFVAAEAIGAVLCLLVLPLAAVLRAADASGAFSPGLPTRLLLVAGACALPCLPLGASLPALVRAVVVRPGTAGALLRWLYAANTVGAVAGVLLATGWGFELLGLSGTVRAAVAAQALVAVGGLWLDAASPRPNSLPSVAPASARALRVSGLEVAAFLSGAAGLAVQVAWIRRLTPALGTTSYAFGTVLAAYLLAVALGAALLGPRGARPAGRRPVLVLALAALPVVFLVPAVAPAARWAGEALADAVREGEATAGRLLLIRSVAAAAVLVPATVLGAAALPWLVQAADPSLEASGAASGRLLAVNTLGSAIAAVTAGLLAIPALGTAGTLVAAAALYLLAAAAAASGRVRGALIAVGCAAAGVVAWAAVAPEDVTGSRDPWARDAVGATFDPVLTDPAAAPATFFAEGRVSTVVVRDRDSRPELWVDGKVVASGSPTDRLHLSLLGHLPMLVHPRPRRVAVVALGTGITATACAAHAPDVLDVFELEGEVARAAPAFAPVGGGLPPSARLAVVDGRYGLLRSDERYDVVTTDPVHPAAAGSAELYTVEHYRLVSSRLAEDGIACQWLPLYELSTDDVRGVLRTFAAVFHTAVFVAGPDLVILGSKSPFAIDPDAMDARITGPVADALRPLGLAASPRLLGLLLADPDRTARLGGEGPLNTDDRPVLEFSSARSQYTGSSTENLAWLGFAPSPPSSILSRESRDPTGFAAGLERSRRLRRAMGRWMEGGEEAHRRALASFEGLASEDPADALSATMREELRLILAREALAVGETEQATALAREVLSGTTSEDRQRLGAAEVLHGAGLVEEARGIASDLVSRMPRSERARRLAAGSR